MTTIDRRAFLASLAGGGVAAALPRTRDSDPAHPIGSWAFDAAGNSYVYMRASRAYRLGDPVPLGVAMQDMPRGACGWAQVV